MCRYRGNVFIAVLTGSTVCLEKKPWNLGFGILDTGQIRGPPNSLDWHLLLCGSQVSQASLAGREYNSQHQPCPPRLITHEVYSQLLSLDCRKRCLESHFGKALTSLNQEKLCLDFTASV